MLEDTEREELRSTSMFLNQDSQEVMVEKVEPKLTSMFLNQDSQEVMVEKVEPKLTSMFLNQDSQEVMVEKVELRLTSMSQASHTVREDMVTLEESKLILKEKELLVDMELSSSDHLRPNSQFQPMLWQEWIHTAK